jgi:hypothetical protein
VSVGLDGRRQQRAEPLDLLGGQRGRGLYDLGDVVVERVLRGGSFAGALGAPLGGLESHPTINPSPAP